MTDPAGISPSSSADDLATLQGKVAKGTGWIIATRLAVRLTGFINTLILARLLVPADFGLVAIGVAAMQLLQNLTDVGLAQAVIRFRDATRDDLNTLFTMSVIRGLVSALLLCAIAPLSVQFYDDPRVFWVFLTVALYPLLIGFLNPRFYEFERDLDFTKEFLVTGLNKLAAVAVSITIALTFRSYMAIILGLVAGGLVQLLLSYAVRPWRPSFSLASFRKVFAFTGWLTGVSFMAALNNKLDALLLGRFIGPAGTGTFYVGEQLAELPTREMGEPIARAIYPGFSSLQSTPDKMRETFLQGVTALAATALPAAIGFAFVAEDAIALLLGQKWENVVPVIEFITPVLGLQTLLLASQGLAMAQDRVKLVFWREFLFFLIRTPIFVWAALSYGLMGAIYAVAVTGLIHVSLNLWLYQTLNHRPFWEPLWAARRSLLAVTAMAAWFVWARPATPVETLPLLARLGADILSGALVFLTVQYALWRFERQPEGIEKTLADRLAGTRP